MKSIRNTIIYTALFIVPLLGFSQATIFVDVNAGGANDGSSWNDAYTSILDGIAAATAGDEIWVADGSYYLHQGGANGDTAIWLKTDVDLYGGFAGGESSLNDRDYENNLSILDGYTSTQTRQVGHVIIADSVTNCTVDGFVIQNAYARSSSIFLDQAACQSADRGDGGTSAAAVLACAGGSNGGGILINQSDPLIQNCIIQNNEAAKGAGVYVMAATATSFGTYPAPTFVNCTIADNYATARGAGVSLDLWTNPTFENCQFLRNDCDDKGGALYLDWNCSPILINCLLVENTAIRGGAMGIDGSSSPVLIHCTVVNNFSNDLGAGLYTGSYNTSGGNGNTPYLINSIIWGNHTEWGGAKDLAVWHQNHFNIENSLIGVGFNSNSVSAISNTDPLLIDTLNGDYKLSASSPTIDAGTGISSLLPAISIPTTDILGNLRTGNPDLGAFELSSTVFPIELLAFNAILEGRKVRLEWLTATEVNNDYFSLESSIDGRLWSELAQVDGAGNSHEVRSYVEYDDDPNWGMNYYRLKQIDLNGNFSYSHIESIRFTDQLELHLYPSILTEGDIIHIIGAETVDIDLYDVQGQLMKQEKDFSTQQSFNLDELPKGLYLIHLRDKSQVKTAKILWY